MFPENIYKSLKFILLVLLILTIILLLSLTLSSLIFNRMSFSELIALQKSIMSIYLVIAFVFTIILKIVLK